MEPNNKSCCIIMPMTTQPELVSRYDDDQHFRNVLKRLILPAIKTCGLRPVGPSASATSIIPADIVNNVLGSDFLLCDMSGANANVFFELGMRTAKNKSAILIIDEQSTVPFDIQANFAHRYDGLFKRRTVKQEVTRLIKHIKLAADGLNEGNSFWKHFSTGLANEIADSPRRRMSERLQGYWWQFIKEDHGRGVSFAECAALPTAANVSFSGRAYRSRGSYHGYWRSKGTCLNPETNELFYSWEGRQHDRPSSTFHGVGHMVFDPAESAFEYASGFFYAPSLDDLTHSRTKHVQMARATDEEIVTMRGRSDKAKQSLLCKKLGNPSSPAD